MNSLNGASIHFSGINLIPERCILLQLFAQIFEIYFVLFCRK